MSPNGLRRWRRYAKKCRYRSRKEGTRATGATAHGATARALFWKARNHPNFALPPNPFTARSLVGMSQKARKRLRHDRLFGPNVAPTKLLLADSLTVQLHIGERLRPCPGCCACWGHRISSAYGEIAECCGPQTSGKRKSQIKAMRKWQETLADNCDGSGVLPARRS